MADIFTITVPLPKGTYPGVNHLGVNGHRGGPKTKCYNELFSLVEDAAKAEMLRTGWITAVYYCEGFWTRYHRNKVQPDAANGAKCENDALERAGVILNDTLIRPMHMNLEYDPEGEDRISIVLVRRYPPLIAIKPATAPAVRAPRKRKAKVSKSGIRKRVEYEYPFVCDDCGHGAFLHAGWIGKTYKCDACDHPSKITAHKNRARVGESTPAGAERYNESSQEQVITHIRKMPPAIVAGKKVPYEEGRRLLLDSLGGR